MSDGKARSEEDSSSASTAVADFLTAASQEHVHESKFFLLLTRAVTIETQSSADARVSRLDNQRRGVDDHVGGRQGALQTPC